jgi:predicted amidohydrolase
VDGVTVGLSICYDLRFPELYRSLALRGAEVLLVPSAFTAYTGAAHWEVLLRARAVENGCFVVAPAQVGEHLPGRDCWGHSMIVDPWGEVLAELAVDAGVCVAGLDLARLAEVRAQIPPLGNRRPDAYRLQRAAARGGADAREGEGVDVREGAAMVAAVRSRERGAARTRRSRR